VPPAPATRGTAAVGWSSSPTAFDLQGDLGDLAQRATQQVSQEVRDQLTAPGSKDAGAALLWGILGLTMCPFLVPSIMAVVYGNRAKRVSSGLNAPNTRGSVGIALGWLGIILWGLFLLLIVIGGIANSTK
jgi:hypothetical protein